MSAYINRDVCVLLFDRFGCFCARAFFLILYSKIFNYVYSEKCPAGSSDRLVIRNLLTFD